MAESKICRGGGGGFILPSQAENDLPDALRAVIYVVAMVYFFLGVSIIADTFMGSIEVITSRRRQVALSTGRVITVRVWNDTVANLSLMALGSSAPEILLSVTELFKREMYAGELGPSTIVGSASFNLLVIIAVCVISIPSTEIRRIHAMEVFVVTLGFMFFAYGWLVLMVSVISPGIISIPEALVTLLAMAPLIYVSYLADIGKFGNLGCHRHKVEVKPSVITRACELLGSFDRDTKDAIKTGFALNPSKMEHIENPSSSDMDDLRRMVKKHMAPGRSRAARRISVTRQFTGGKKPVWNIAPTFGLRSRVSGVTGFSHNEVPVVQPKGKGSILVQFACESQSMCADLASKSVTLVRTGDTQKAVQVLLAILVPEVNPPDPSDLMAQSYQSANWQTAASGEARSSVEGFRSYGFESFNSDKADVLPEVFFESGEDKKVIEVTRPEAAKAANCFIVELIGVQVLEDGETPTVIGAESSAKQNGEDRGTSKTSMRTKFNTGLLDLEGSTTLSKEAYAEAKKAAGMGPIGPISRTSIALSRHQGHGKLEFAFERLLIVGAPEKQTMEVMVQRVDGCTGKVSCNFRTERLSAVPGYDYSETDGTLEFEEGVTEQFIELEILPKSGNESKDDFLTVLQDPEGGAEFDPNNDGGTEAEILTVSIGPCDLVHVGAQQKLARWLDDKINFDEVWLGTAEWSEQFKEAIYCNGSPEEQADASVSDWCFHILALPWKLIFTLVPPTTYCSGWVCFWTSLVFCGALTAIIGDVAELFGCIMGLPNIVTAITFVALGTSMPDLFASKTAAAQDPFADASIVNVTGSNSVNVFLGLGLPWTIGAIYWRASEWDGEWANTYPDVADRCWPDRTMEFVVESDDLGFSVAIFTGTSFFALTILVARRFAIGGELGGPFLLKAVSSLTLVVLWICYITLSAWFALRQDDADLTEGLAVFGSCVGIVILSFSLFMYLIIKEVAYGDYRGQRHHGNSSNDTGDAEDKDSQLPAVSMQDGDMNDAGSQAGAASCPSCDAKRDQGSPNAPNMKIDEPLVADEFRVLAMPETPEKPDPFNEFTSI